MPATLQTRDTRAMSKEPPKGKRRETPKRVEQTRVMRPISSQRTAGELPARYRQELGAYLRELRLAVGLTQEEAAAYLGLTKGSMSNFELGRHTISPTHYFKLATLYKVPNQELGKNLLRWSDPWIYGLLMGTRDPELHKDLDATGTFD